MFAVICGVGVGSNYNACKTILKTDPDVSPFVLPDCLWRQKDYGAIFFKTTAYDWLEEDPDSPLVLERTVPLVPTYGTNNYTPKDPYKKLSNE